LAVKKIYGSKPVDVRSKAQVPLGLVTDVCSTDPHNQWVTIGALPDDVLLEIFDFYLDDFEIKAKESEEVDAWFTLVHVCQQWRYVVIASPRRLNLRLLCTRYRPVKGMLEVWPALPISVWESFPETSLEDGVENIFAALEHSDRIHGINFQRIPSSLLGRYIEMMQVPFPALTSLELMSSDDEWPPDQAAIPNSFLGGSAQRLRSLDLNGVPFPALRRLLLTATDLVKLSLWRIPHSAYISPGALVTCLSSLAGLRSLTLGFLSHRSRPTRRPPPLIRAILPALVYLEFKGTSEYLEDLVARVDTPRLNETHVTYLNQLIFDTPRFHQFLDRAEQFEPPNQANVIFDARDVVVSLSLSTTIVDPEEDARILFRISCADLDWQLSSVTQVCTPTLPPLSTLEHLYISLTTSQQQDLQVDIEHDQWPEFFHPFSAVKNLYLSEEIAPSVARALQELSVESVTEVLPALQNIFLEGLQPLGPVEEAIGTFTAARQLHGNPVAVHEWEREW
jgi:hypothetical protein